MFEFVGFVGEPTEMVLYIYINTKMTYFKLITRNKTTRELYLKFRKIIKVPLIRKFSYIYKRTLNPYDHIDHTEYTKINELI